MTLVGWASLLVVLAVVDWVSTLVSVRAALQLKEPALEERATASVILTVAATLVAILAAAYLANVPLPDGLGVSLLIGALLLMSAPQIIWAVAYRIGRFR